MTKDYAKKRSAGKKTSKSGNNSYLLLWIVTLVLFGLFTFGLVYVGKHQHQLRHHAKIAAKHQETTLSPTNETANDSTEPKFDFYTLLPQKNKNVIVPEYELEIASVKTYTEADHLKAEVSLLGLEVNIDLIKKDDVQIYHVTTGPYDNKNAALADQSRLKQNNIKSVIKKLK
jgi:hypothetical protein